MNELFFHECRAAGLVFKTPNDWCKWLTDNSYDIKKPVAEKALSMFKNPQQAAHLAWLLENKKNNRS